MTATFRTLVRGGGVCGLTALLLAASPALSESCRLPASGAKSPGGRSACKPEERLRSYEPDVVRSGKQPGFINLGNGTEVRVGGRAQMDYDVRR